MSERGRNIVVGLFVLAGLAVLALLIVKFQTGVTYFTGMGDYYIEIQASQTAAVLPGQTIHLNGIAIGQIHSVGLANDQDPRQGVIITAAISHQFSIPEDVTEVSIHQGQLGPPYIDIKVLPSHSAVMMKKTPGEVVATLTAHIPPGPFSQISTLANELKPALKELGPALTKIGDLAENLNAMFAGPADDSTDPAAERLDVKGLAQKFSQTLDNLDALIGGQENRENFKKSLANLRQAGDDATKVLEELKGFAGQARQTTVELDNHMRDVAQAIIRNSEQVSTLLAQLNKAAQQINQGQGTAGKILYDPQLYEEMLSVSKELNQAVQTLRILLDKWNKQGLELKW